MVAGAGVAPAYFFRRMTTEEVEDVIAGVARRERAGWEQARLLAGLYYTSMTGEPFRLRFSWDEQEAPPTEEEMDDLRRRAYEMEHRLRMHGKKKD